ncbi:MAG: BRO family protein, partial [Pseudomonadota bacterium]|nr:BRO family protein [Pseudomonadota bacterium]
MSNLAVFSFREVTFNPINSDGQVWLRASEIAQALGYAREDSVSRIFDRNSDEFTEKMTQLIDNPHTVNLTVRIFNLRGCHLLAMFART